MRGVKITLFEKLFKFWQIFLDHIQRKKKTNKFWSKNRCHSLLALTGSAKSSLIDRTVKKKTNPFDDDERCDSDVNRI